MFKEFLTAILQSIMFKEFLPFLGHHQHCTLEQNTSCHQQDLAARSMSKLKTWKGNLEVDLTEPPQQDKLHYKVTKPKRDNGSVPVTKFYLRWEPAGLVSARKWSKGSI